MWPLLMQESIDLMKHWMPCRLEKNGTHHLVFVKLTLMSMWHICLSKARPSYVMVEAPILLSLRKPIEELHFLFIDLYVVIPYSGVLLEINTAA